MATTEEALTITEVSVTHPTEIMVVLSNDTSLRLSVGQIVDLQSKAAGTGSVLERTGEP